MSEYMRLATLDDSDTLRGIYAPYVRDTAISLELDPPTAGEFRRRVESIAAEYPYLVHIMDGRITGFAYAAKQMERACYRFNVSVSVYLDSAWHGRGIGTKLYSRLLALCAELGYWNAYAGITLPNTKSTALHASFGFAPVGTYHRTGYKFGKWHDVIWLEKSLRDAGGEPAPLRKISELPAEFIEKTLKI